MLCSVRRIWYAISSSLSTRPSPSLSISATSSLQQDYRTLTLIFHSRAMHVSTPTSIGMQGKVGGLQSRDNQVHPPTTFPSTHFKHRWSHLVTGQPPCKQHCTSDVVHCKGLACETSTLTPPTYLTSSAASSELRSLKLFLSSPINTASSNFSSVNSFSSSVPLKNHSFNFSWLANYCSHLGLARELDKNPNRTRDTSNQCSFIVWSNAGLSGGEDYDWINARIAAKAQLRPLSNACAIQQLYSAVIQANYRLPRSYLAIHETHDRAN